MRRALTVIGTRPQLIKYSALWRGIRESFDEVLVDTGQHYDPRLSTLLFQELGVPAPAYNLSATGKSVLPQMADMLCRLHEIIERERPDLLICFGDTNSTLAATLAALKSGIEVVHVEAGERNFTADGARVAPHLIPEEGNRVMTDHVASVLLCASRRAVANLRAEQAQGRIAYTGDITYDLYLERIGRALEGSTALAERGLEPGGYHFCTFHRALNTDSRERLSSIVAALNALEEAVLIPMHPRTRKMLEQFGLLGSLAQHVRVVEPVSYLESIVLSHEAARVITDSGGVVREAYFNGVPSVYLDDSTEWLDIMTLGWSTMAGADTEKIVAAVRRPAPAERPPIFGDGNAIQRTIEEIKGC